MSLKLGGQLIVEIEAATWLYYSAIAAALAFHGVHITSLTAAQLRDGFRWAAAQPWADPDLAIHLRDAEGIVS
jgi:hypothetical protein